MEDSFIHALRLAILFPTCHRQLFVNVTYMGSMGRGGEVVTRPIRPHKKVHIPLSLLVGACYTVALNSFDWLARIRLHM